MESADIDIDIDEAKAALNAIFSSLLKMIDEIVPIYKEFFDKVFTLSSILTIPVDAWVDASPRVQHLAMHSKKWRTRKKNISRIRREYLLETKRRSNRIWKQEL